jgi:hypothetical protein
MSRKLFFCVISIFSYVLLGLEVRQSKNHLRLQRQRVGVEQAY